MGEDGFDMDLFEDGFEKCIVSYEGNKRCKRVFKRGDGFTESATGFIYCCQECYKESVEKYKRVS